MSELDDKDLQSPDIPQDVDAYVNYYGLTGDPFNPDNPLFFTTPQLGKLLRLFNYLARFSRKLVIVSGDSGAGKTALLEHFVNEQDDQEKVCFFTGLNTDTPLQVLYEIARQLDIDVAGESESLEQLTKAIRDYSLQRLEQGKNCFVIIDDGHLLETNVLEQLYFLTFDDVGQRSAISLLLGGQPLLFERIQAVVPSDREVKALFHQKITPFSYDEMLQYLEFHFEENAGHSKPPFSDDTYQQIHQQSEGLPGRINKQAKEMLTGGVSRLVSDVEGNKRSKGVAISVAVILLIVGGVFWWQSSQEKVNEAEVAALEMIGQLERSESASKNGDLGNEKIFAEPEQRIGEALPKAEAGADTIELEENDNEEPGSVVSELLGRQDTLDAEDGVLVGRVAEIVPDEIIVSEDNRTEGVIDKAGAAAIPLSSVEKDIMADVSAISEPAAVLENAPEELKTVAKSVKPVSRLAKNEARILTFESSEYVIQLLGARKEENIIVFIAKVPSNENVLYFEKTHKGAPWYVLIYGRYADRASANAQAEKLAAELTGIKPWVRSVVGIQDTIRANQ